MIELTEQFIKKNINYPQLITALKLAFRQKNIQCPPKQVYEYQSKKSTKDNVMLLMPAWDNSSYFGVKLITTTPSNEGTDIPYINGRYLLFDANTGMPAAQMDAKLITHIRTAATSVLAAQHLAKNNADSVLIIGNGNISPYYIRAYSAMEGIKTIYLWGRNKDKSKKVFANLESLSVEVKAVADYESVIQSVDIISCITSATTPLVKKQHLKLGQHLDLAGGFTPEMIEVSTEVVAESSIYVDNQEVTPHHAGELVQAMQEGKIQESDVLGDLTFLCTNDLSKRKSAQEITLFKSTGMAIEDFVIGKMLVEKYILAQNRTSIKIAT